MIWNRDMECLGPDELRDLQSRRLTEVVSLVFEKSPVYSQKLKDAGIRIGDIRTIDDIKKLPFTRKEDLRDNYPFGLFSSDLKDINELHVSSGTTGDPTVVGYTKEDLELWAEVMARVLCCAGAGKGDMIHIAYGYGLFTGGLGMHYGALKLGLTVIPVSSGQTKRQLKLIKDFKPRILTCTPSYALYLAEEIRAMGVDPRSTSLEIGLFGAEPWTESMRNKIEQTWGLIATDIYGLAEIIGPGVAQECHCRNGLHVFSDVFYPEVIDTNTGEEVKPGEEGELVLTTLTKKGFPLLRYRTRDIVSIDDSPCACGRTSPRMSKVKGRTDDMITIRGVNIFPSQIEHVLLEMEETHPHYHLVVDRGDRELDTLEVQVEVVQEMFSDEIKRLEGVRNKIKKEIEDTIGVGISLKLVEPRTLARSEGKSRRVEDRRDL